MKRLALNQTLVLKYVFDNYYIHKSQYTSFHIDKGAIKELLKDKTFYELVAVMEDLPKTKIYDYSTSEYFEDMYGVMKNMYFSKYLASQNIYLSS